MIKIIGLSDPPTMPTGFGRVSRELFDRLSKLTVTVDDSEDGKLIGQHSEAKYDLAYLSTNWIGSARNRNIVYYSGSHFGESDLPAVVRDFAGEDKMLLWTLMDPWQTSWLSHPKTSPHARVSPRVIEDMRGRLKWIMHFTIDGEGPTGKLPRWVHEYVEAADYPVAMSEWGRGLIQESVKKDVRFISHAVDTAIYKPMDKEASRMVLEQQFTILLAQQAIMNGLTEKEKIAEWMRGRQISLRGKFVVTCVMANRSRKYWFDALRAFAVLQEKLGGRAVLLAICGDASGQQEGALPLIDIAREQGLRMPGENVDPDVWFIETVGIGSKAEGTLAILINAADVTWLISAGEGFGLTQLESHACGRPCVVGRYSASVELIVNKREGIEPATWWWEGQAQVKRPIYRYRDFADRTAWIAENPGWAAEVAAAGEEQARKRAWVNILPLWEALFEEAHGSLFPKDSERSGGQPDASGDASGKSPGLPTISSAEEFGTPGLVQGSPPEKS